MARAEAASTIAPETREAALEAFSRALNREAASVSRRPGLLWQQLHNRLQWEDEPLPAILLPETELRTAPGSSPWMRLRTRLSESPQLIRTLEGHTDAVMGCVVSPDGSFVVSASDDRTLKIWDLSSGEERASLRGHVLGVDHCAVSPDGSLVVSAGTDGSIKVWDSRTGEELASFADPRPEDGVTYRKATWAMSPDGSFLVWAASDDSLKVVDAKTGEERATLRGHTHAIVACSVSADSSRVVSESWDETIRVWDSATGDELARLKAVIVDSHVVQQDPRERPWIWPPPHNKRTATSPDGSYTIDVRSDDIDVRDAVTGHVRAVLRGHADMVLACAVSPDGSSIVSASFDNTLKIWDALTGQERVTLRGHGGPVNDCAVSPDGSLIVSASDDRTLKVWGPIRRTDDETAPSCHAKRVTACAVSPDASFTVSAGGDGVLKLWDPESGEELRTLARRGGWMEWCAVAPDGSFVVSGGEGGILELWDTASGKKLRTLEGHDDTVMSCAVAGDGSFVVSADEAGILKVWDAATWEPVATLEGHDGSVDSCAVSPDGSFVVSAGVDGAVKVWDVRTWVERGGGQQAHGWPAWACAVASDASFVVSASDDTTLMVWDTVTGQAVRTLTGHTGWVRACAASPDSAYLVSASNDGTLKVWDTDSWSERATIVLWDDQATGQRLQAQARAQDIVTSCAITPDGARLVSASLDKSVRLWDPDGEEICAILLPGGLHCLALHPRLPLVTCGDSAGNVHLIELVGIEYGPIVGE